MKRALEHRTTRVGGQCELIHKAERGSRIRLAGLPGRLATTRWTGQRDGDECDQGEPTGSENAYR